MIRLCLLSNREMATVKKTPDTTPERTASAPLGQRKRANGLRGTKAAETAKASEASAADSTEPILLELTGRLDTGSPVPLYQQISAQIEEWIETGRLQCGDQLASERRMTELLGVSRRTVRAALSALIERRYLSAAHGRGNFILEPPSRRPRHFLALERFAASHWGGNPRHYDLIHEAEVQGNGQVHYKYAPTLEMLRDLLAHPPQGYDGILIYRPRQDWINEMRAFSNEFLQSLPLPFLIGGRDLRGTRLNFVSPDHQAQTFAAAQEMIRLGHREIALITGHIDQEFMKIASDGYRKALQDAGLPCREENLLLLPSAEASMLEEAIVSFLAERRFTAVIVAGSAFSIPFERAFQRSSILIPDELSAFLITEHYMFDELTTRWSGLVYPDREVIVRCLSALSELSHGLVKGPVQELIPPGTVKGATCREL